SLRLKVNTLTKTLRDMERILVAYSGGVDSTFLLKASYEVLEGKVADTLAHWAEKSEVDLIVIASHGRSGVSRWIMGSVAERLLRSACVPVLMIRAPGCFPGI
ncbi:MAG: universal stress protein, partial [Desulfobacterales bacterium]|nr:universal stress protein [Desulfobacterales bacterium]